MQLGEAVAVLFINEEMSECPFTKKIEDSGVSEVQEEHVEDDSEKSASKEQQNNGGKLGENLVSGSAGSKGTLGGPYLPDSFVRKENPLDSKRAFRYAFVPGADEYDDGVFPFVVAAHHLIPGKASLKQSTLKNYMTKGETVKTDSGKSWKIACHIGYNVNGSHNGVWLPGNYAIRKPTKPWYKSPDKTKKWGDLGTHKWCTHYVAAVTKVCGGQFHDAHTKYNEAAKKLLNKIATKLVAHQDHCEDCGEKMNGEIEPPYFIKHRLHNISNYLHRQVTGMPPSWKRPWFASDKWRDKAFAPSGGQLNHAFLDAYDLAREESSM